MARTKRKSSLKTLFSGKRLLLICLIALLLIGGGAVWAMRSDSQPVANPSDSSPPGSPASNTSVNLSPPTEQEKQEADAHKAELAQPENSSTSKRQVTPIIVSADKYGASAYVSGVFEEGGTCTAIFTKGDNKITATSQGFQNSNYTSCAPLKLSGALNIDGTWSVVLSYSSKTASGSSKPYSFEVN